MWSAQLGIGATKFEIPSSNLETNSKAKIQMINPHQKKNCPEEMVPSAVVNDG